MLAGVVAALCCCTSPRAVDAQSSRQGIARPELSDIGFTVPGMTESPRRYDVTITVDRDTSRFPNPAELAVVAGQAASARAARVVSPHTARR